MINNYLNLEELTYTGNRSERKKLDFFRSQLNRCHNMISNCNKMGIKSCKYPVPSMSFEVPIFNFAELVEFLCTNLINNGLKIKYLKDSQRIYISWAPNDLNIDAYKKTRAAAEENIVKSRIIEPGDMSTIRKIQSKEPSNVLMNELLPINKKKFINAQFIQKKRDNYYWDK
jgi:hypothetical protein